MKKFFNNFFKELKLIGIEVLKELRLILFFSVETNFVKQNLKLFYKNKEFRKVFIKRIVGLIFLFFSVIFFLSEIFPFFGYWERGVSNFLLFFFKFNFSLKDFYFLLSFGPVFLFKGFLLFWVSYFILKGMIVGYLRVSGKEYSYWFSNVGERFSYFIKIGCFLIFCFEFRILYLGFINYVGDPLPTRIFEALSLSMLMFMYFVWILITKMDLYPPWLDATYELENRDSSRWGAADDDDYVAELQDFYNIEIELRRRHNIYIPELDHRKQLKELLSFNTKSIKKILPNYDYWKIYEMTRIMHLMRLPGIGNFEQAMLEMEGLQVLISLNEGEKHTLKGQFLYSMNLFIKNNYEFESYRFFFNLAAFRKIFQTDEPVERITSSLASVGLQNRPQKFFGSMYDCNPAGDQLAGLGEGSGDVDYGVGYITGYERSGEKRVNPFYGKLPNQIYWRPKKYAGIFLKLCPKQNLVNMKKFKVDNWGWVDFYKNKNKNIMWKVDREKGKKKR